MEYSFEDLANDLGSLERLLSDSEQKKFLKSEAKKFKKEVIKKAKEEVTEESGDYFLAFKVGTPKKKNGMNTVPTLNDSPYGHLIEYGHKIVDKTGTERGFVQGKFILTNAANEYKPIFLANAEEWVDRAIDRSDLG